MTFSPAALYLPDSNPHTPDGGNWTAHTHARPFLFTEQGQKLRAQITNTGRIPASVHATSAPAASPHGCVRVPQALPFFKVNNCSHVDGSPSVGRTEHNPGAFA